MGSSSPVKAIGILVGSMAQGELRDKLGLLLGRGGHEQFTVHYFFSDVFRIICCSYTA